MIKKLTEQYISCFNNKDIQGVIPPKKAST